LSYHISPRVLERLAGREPDDLFANCVHHILTGDQPALRQHEAAQAFTSKPPSAAVLEQHIRELWELDLNPLARVARQVRSPASVTRAWNAFNASGNVTTPLLLGESHHAHQPLAKRTLRSQVFPLMDVNLTTASVLVEVILDTVQRTVRQHRPGTSDESSISGLARILGKEHTIVHDASLFFEAHPGANVAALSRALGCHPRTVERQFRQQGLTAIDLKRACALVGATRRLWTAASLADIACAQGYADQAHMSREISRSTGGLSPSFLRSLVSH